MSIAIKCLVHGKNMATDGSAVVEQWPHCPKVEGSSPAPTFSTGRENKAQMIILGTWSAYRHLSNIDCLMACTACLVCFISTVNVHTKKKKKKG